MATINRTSGNENKNFQQIESDSWSNIYLPAICAGVVMTIVLLMAVSCSKKSDDSVAKVSAPIAPAVEAPVTAAVLPPTPQAAKKVAKKHRPANATYVNGTYGVLFSYPWKYSLQSADKQKELPVAPGFVKSGAVEIATVDMPDTGYPETDFSSALLNVSMNAGVTSDECGQFAEMSKNAALKSDQKIDAKTAVGDSAKTSGDASMKAGEIEKSTSEALKPELIKFGANEFSEIEQMQGAGEKQSDLKYFHLFKNGACYEFALDVETSRKADEDLAQVDRGQVFKQLEKILASARIKEVELPGVEKTETATSAQPTTTQTTTQAPAITGTQGTTSNQPTEKAQVVTPEQK